MKKMFMSTAVVAMLLSTSCQNEEIISQQESNLFRLEVQKGASSRTELKGDGTVVWSEGDKLYVYGDNGSEGTLMLDKEDIGKTAGSFVGFVKGKVEDLKYVVYGDVVKNGLQKGIRLSDFEYPNSNAPLFGNITNGVNNVDLINLCSMIRINIIDLKVGDKISIVGDGISGIGNLDETNKSLTAAESSEKIITVTNAEVGKAIDIPVFAGSVIKKVKVNNLECVLNTSVTAVKNQLISLPVLKRTTTELIDVENSNGSSSGEQEVLNIVETVEQLEGALANAQSGDVIYLKDGIYDGAFYVGNKSITLKAINKHQAIIEGKFGIASSELVKFENITFGVSDYTTKNNTVGHGTIDKANNAIMMIYCANVNVEGCSFKEMNKDVYAIRVRNVTEAASVKEKLEISNSLFNGVRGIRSFTNVSVKGCEFEGMKYSCVDVLGFGQDINGSVEFTNNTSVENITGVQLKDGNGYIKNVTFNVGGNVNCNTITYDGKNMNNLFFETYTYTGEVDSMKKQ